MSRQDKVYLKYEYNHITSNLVHELYLRRSGINRLSVKWPVSVNILIVNFTRHILNFMIQRSLERKHEYRKKQPGKLEAAS